MSAGRRRVEPTTEQLRLAFRQLRRPGWPDDLEACLDHPIYGPPVRGIARNLARAKPTLGVVKPAVSAAAATVPPTPSQDEVRRPVRGFRPARAMQPFDARRAAANDRDD